ncbi:MAG TPA: multicopper oxidase domain-containing protein [Acidobacteriaceae bacterium]|nr:multicopper oxidase domain-containing protein [Acidobacteriaceae bacterium]
MRMVEFERSLHSHLPPARLWGYEGEYPGPVFEARVGAPVQVEWSNDLPQRHLFLIDQRLRANAPPTPAVRAVPHLHGSRTPSYSDGLPENWFTPGHSVVYHYPNEQLATTLWYHDHAAGIHRLNLYAGLAGFYLLRDTRELAMNLPSGDFEIPLMLQDRTVDARGQLVYQPAYSDGTPLPPGRWGPQLFGDLPVVNGGISPFLEVEPRRYRFRVLNAANGRFFNLFMNLAKSPTDIPSLITFHQIGSDGGLLAAPVPLQHVLLGPAERADLIVDFTGLEGRTVTLSNNATSPWPGWDLLQPLYAALPELMQFRVTRPLSSPARAFSLPPPVSVPRLRPSQAVRTRTFVLTDQMDAKGRSIRMLIDGRMYDAPTTEFPVLGSIERWRFLNTTDDTHPMHLHLVQFQIVERQGYDYGMFLLHNRIVMKGFPRPPAPNEAGWKDTALLNPGEVLTILVPFLGFTGKYLYHCHIAEHAENDMMRPFVVVVPGTVSEAQPSRS